LNGLAIQDSVGCGIATFSGKSTYMTWDPAANSGLGGYVNTGGQDFAVYAKDCNEPGSGYDYMWVRGAGNLAMLSPAELNSVVLSGGNLAIPHKPKK